MGIEFAMIGMDNIMEICNNMKLIKTKAHFDEWIILRTPSLRLFAVPTMSQGPYNYNYIFKYIIIGDMGVGKSCLLHQFTEKKCKKLNGIRLLRSYLS